MATNVIKTRIKNKVDTLAAWNENTAQNALLDGEIALVRVPTGSTYTNPVTGEAEPVVELLMKVGDGVHAFSDAALPWLSAKASDVYNWAKTAKAEDVPITIVSNYSGTPTTLGNYLSKFRVDIDANAATLATGVATLNKLQGNASTTGSIANSIKAAIDALDSTTTGSGNFVKAVTQANGIVSVTKGNIAESDLPDISASKIKVSDTQTLVAKLADQDALIAANTEKLAGHTDTAINTLIDTKLGGLDFSSPSASSSTSTEFIDTVSQTNGKISATKKKLPTASSTVAGIAKLGATGGSATYDSVFGAATTSIASRLAVTEGDITSLKTSVAGGVHFIGTVTAEPSTSATVTISGSNASHTATAGDVVIYSGKEYIYTGSAWEQLGDVTRIGALETKINNLDYSTTNAVATTHKFASQVTQADGKIAVTYTQPTADDVSYTSTASVKATLDSLSADKANKTDVYTKTETGTQITNAINALDYSDPTASGTTTSFIATVSQTNGKISATKKTITSASTSAAGIVKLSSATNSAVETLAATPKAVKSAYDLANTASSNASDAQTRVTAVEGDYLRVYTNTSTSEQSLRLGKSGSTDIIFDCGNAP